MKAAAFVLFLALGLALGLVVATTERAQALNEARPPSRLSAQVPVYPGSVFLDLGDGVHVDGLARNLGYSLTEDASAKVCDFYRGALSAQGLLLQEQREGDEFWILARNPMTTSLITIAVSPSERGTLIVASESDYALEPKPRLIALPPFCSRSADTGAQDRGVNRELVLASCQGTPKEVVNWYGQHLGETAVKELHSSKDSLVVKFESQREEWLITTHSLPTGNLRTDQTTLTVSLTQAP